MNFIIIYKMVAILCISTTCMLPVCYLFDSIHTSAKGNWKIRKAETVETENGNGINKTYI